MKQTECSSWIGVDLDGTLAHYEGFDGAGNMVVLHWIVVPEMGVGL